MSQEEVQSLRTMLEEAQRNLDNEKVRANTAEQQRDFARSQERQADERMLRMQDNEASREFRQYLFWCFGIAGCILLVVFLLFWGLPQWNVWRRTLSGESQFREAEWNRQIASLDAEAEITRAKGVAESNKIIAGGLRGNPDYLRYLWIQQIAGNNRAQVIYLPTEAGLPITEAGSRLSPTNVE